MPQPATTSDTAARPAAAPDPSAGRVPARVAVLAVGTFAIGTDEFAIPGVLPGVSSDLRVDVGAAGQLVTVFAVAYALGSPVLTALTGRWPRRRVLLAGLAVFVLANIATAVAPWYGAVLAARVVTGLGAALVTPIAGATAAAMAGPAHRARAIAIVTLGLTGSMALGAPIGTLLGSLVGWRGTIWLIAALGLASAAAVALWLPAVPAPPAVGLRERLAPLADRRVALLVAVTAALMTGVYLVYTYFSVVLRAATGGSGGTLAGLVLAFGVAGCAGSLVTARWTDRFGARPVLLVSAAVLALDFAALPLLGGTLAAAVPLVVVNGLAAWSITVPQQHRLMAARPDAAALVVSLNAAGIFLAVSLSGGLGAVWLRGLPGVPLPWLAVGFVLLGLAGSELAHRLRR